MVCNADTILKSANLLLIISLSSFRVNAFMWATIGSIYKSYYNTTWECQPKKEAWRSMSIVKKLNLKQSIASTICGMYLWTKSIEQCEFILVSMKLHTWNLKKLDTFLTTSCAMEINIQMISCRFLCIIICMHILVKRSRNASYLHSMQGCLTEPMHRHWPILYWCLPFISSQYDLYRTGLVHQQMIWA